MQTRERDFVRDFVIGDFVMQTLLSDGVRARIFCTPKLSLRSCLRVVRAILHVVHAL